MRIPSGSLKNAGDREDELFPARCFLSELASSRGRERIEPGTPVVLRRSPLGVDPSALLEAAQGGVQRALVHRENVARDLLDYLRDPPAVHAFMAQHAQDEEVERP